jgi:hypothetical protein
VGSLFLFTTKRLTPPILCSDLRRRTKEYCRVYRAHVLQGSYRCYLRGEEGKRGADHKNIIKNPFRCFFSSSFSLKKERKLKKNHGGRVPLWPDGVENLTLHSTPLCPKRSEDETTKSSVVYCFISIVSAAMDSSRTQHR